MFEGVFHKRDEQQRRHLHRAGVFRVGERDDHMLRVADAHQGYEIFHNLYLAAQRHHLSAVVIQHIPHHP